MTDATPDEYLTSRAVRKRYGDVSEMTLWRWERNPALGFPTPIIVNRRRLWRLGDLEQWERARARGSVAASKPAAIIPPPPAYPAA